MIQTTSARLLFGQCCSKSHLHFSVKNTSAGGRWTALEVSDSLQPELQPPLCSVLSLRCPQASGCGRPCRPLPGGRAPWPHTERCRRRTAWPPRWRWRQIVPLYCSKWKKRERVRWRVNLGHSQRGGNSFFWWTLNIQDCYRDARWCPSCKNLIASLHFSDF